MNYLLIIFFGSNRSSLAKINTSHTTCGYCGQQGTQSIEIIGSYAHIYWIPLFPLRKHVKATCSHCKQQVLKEEFSSELRSVYERNQEEGRRPLWHWAGLIVIILLFFTFIV